MRLTERVLEERKHKIIHTAYQLFCEYGIDGITLAQIAKEAGVGASAIYRYFDTKATLLWYTQQILWKEIVEQINMDEQEHLLSAKSGFEELSILLYRFKLLYTQHSGYLLFAIDYKMFLVRNHIILPEQAYGRLLVPVSELFQKALQRGHEDGSVSCKESVEDQFFIIWEIMRGYAEQMVIHDKMYGSDHPFKKQFDLVYQYALDGVKKKA